MTSPDTRVTELVRLVERDYDQTTQFIRSLVGTISVTRGWAVTAWLAVVGVGVQQKNAAIAVLGTFVLFPFGLVDAYYSWLYGQALRHARELENLSAEYYTAIEQGEDDAELLLDFEANLGAHRFGLYSHFRRFSLPEIRSVRPVLVFRVFYPCLFAAGVVAAVLISLFS